MRWRCSPGRQRGFDAGTQSASGASAAPGQTGPPEGDDEEAGGPRSHDLSMAWARFRRCRPQNTIVHLLGGGMARKSSHTVLWRSAVNESLRRVTCFEIVTEGLRKN